MSAIYVSQLTKAFVCPGCEKVIIGDEVLEALRRGIWSCDSMVWPITEQYLIDEQVLA